MPKTSAAPKIVQLTELPDRTGPIGNAVNDLDLDAWKQYPEILTDSLWLIPERDSTGAHAADYHGNFIPQIPHQMMLRYTKRGDHVLDPFMGMGTTMIEAQRLGRHAIGIELQQSIAERARARAAAEPNPHGSVLRIVNGDSRQETTRAKVAKHLEEQGKKHVQMVVMHPPYHDIIHFSNLENDLSNAADLATFLSWFGEVTANCAKLLDRHRYLVLVIGDKYAEGEWIPLGSRTMDVILKQGFTLKSWVVKNMTGNRAKRNLDNLWRYRALRGGFYIFKHEHVLVFKKD
jgi:DNA modification methylase